MNPLTILPQNISGWSTKKADQVYTRNNIFEYMNGAGEIYLAYDFKRLFVREYVKESAPAMVVEIYQMSSSGDAFGIFTQDKDGEEVSIGEEAIYALGLLRFWKGNIFTRILASEETNEIKEIVMKIGMMVAKSIMEKSEKPNIINYLPPSGLQQKSVFYFHKLVSLNSQYFLSTKNILLFSEDTDALLARYKLNDSTARLLFIQYPELEIADKAHSQFIQSYFVMKPNRSEKIQITKTEDQKFVSIKKVNNFLILIFEGITQDTCKWLTSSLEQNLRSTGND